MEIRIKRFFATLRFAQNDNYLDNKGKGVGSGEAASNPFTPSNTITYCHSERSEESLIIPRTTVFNNLKERCRQYAIGGLQEYSMRNIYTFFFGQ